MDFLIAVYIYLYSTNMHTLYKKTQLSDINSVFDMLFFYAFISGACQRASGMFSICTPVWLCESVCCSLVDGAQ